MSDRLEIFDAARLLSQQHRRAGNGNPLTVEITFKDRGELSNFIASIKGSREWLEIENTRPTLGALKTDTTHAFGMTFTYHGVTFFLIA